MATGWLDPPIVPTAHGDPRTVFDPTNARPYLDRFPYVGLPHSGFDGVGDKPPFAVPGARVTEIDWVRPKASFLVPSPSRR